MTEIVKFILSNSKNQPLHNLGDGETPLLAACRNRLHDLAKILLEHSPKLVFISSANGSSPLCEACYNGDSATVDLILHHVMHLITISEHSKEKRLSLDFIDNLGRTSLYHACNGGYFDIVKQLVSFQRENSDRVSLDFSVTVKGSLRTPLHAAALSGSLGIVDLLLDIEGIKINAEAHPSQRTHEKLIENFHTQRGATLPSKVDSNLTPVELEDPSSKAKPSISPNPTPRAFTVVKSQKNKHAGKNEAAFQEEIVKARAQTTVGEGSLCVFENLRNGSLNFSNGKSFDSLFITPLAEACACCHMDIVDRLLLQGARDSIGLACRIAHLIKRPDVVQKILSYHVEISKDSSDDSSEDSGDGLALNWNELKLPICKGTWFTKGAEYFPLAKDQHGCLSLGICGLSRIHLNNNRLVEVPIELFQLQSVRSIDLSSNSLLELPVSGGQSPGSWSLPALISLDLSHNRLTHLPSCVWELPSIKSLTCSSNKLITLLPSGAADAFCPPFSNSLTDIDLSGNELSTVAGFFFKNPDLRSVKLSKNKINNLPDTMWGCGTLGDLDLSCNKLAVLPQCLPEEHHRALSTHQSFPFLQHAGHQEGKVDVKVSKFDEFQSFHTSSIQPRSRVRANLDNQVQQFDYSMLQKLNLSRNEFSSLPEGLACCAPNLTDLDISGNSLGEIDVQLLPATLKKLKARGCKITKIGNVLSKSQLKEVEQNCRHSSSEGFACLHRKHTQLPHLTNLDLSDNLITDLQLIQDRAADDDEEFKITALDLLYPLLNILNLTNNKLVGMFNPNIGRQLHLKSIKLDKNHDLQSVPMEFAYLKKGGRLTELTMKDLPNLVQPPVDYQNAKLSHLLTYMKSMLKE